MNRTVIVTGGASGIGRVCARRFAADGDQVGVIDIDDQGLKLLAKEADANGEEIFTWTQDLCEAGAAQSFVDSIVEKFGGVDVLVNNAGVGIPADVLATPFEDWNHVLDLNLGAVFRMCRAVLPSMLDRGAGVIVNVASVAGLVGIADRAAYCASKAGVVGLTRAMAVDYSSKGIRVNAICPGTVATEWVERMISASADPETTRLSMSQRQLDGQLGTPEEVAEGVFFLASAGGRFVNGSAFIMDGGMTTV